jgi:hypothetical protein
MCDQKSAVSVAEMARMVALSRARFYQLMGSAFPFPLYDVATRRPYYPSELQEACLEVRRRNCGIDGKPVLFQRREGEVARMRPKQSGRKAAPDASRFRGLMAGLRSLGMAGVTAAQVQAALKELHVSDIENKDQGELLRAVFLHLKRQDKSQSAPRKRGDHHDER